jgi:hypothetical protein
MEYPRLALLKDFVSLILQIAHGLGLHKRDREYEYTLSYLVSSGMKVSGNSVIWSTLDACKTRHSHSAACARAPHNYSVTIPGTFAFSARPQAECRGGGGSFVPLIHGTQSSTWAVNLRIQFLPFHLSISPSYLIHSSSTSLPRCHFTLQPTQNENQNVELLPSPQKVLQGYNSLLYDPATLPRCLHLPLVCAELSTDNLWCDYALLSFRLFCDWRSVGQSVLVSVLLLSGICGLLVVGRPFWREEGSVIYS